MANFGIKVDLLKLGGAFVTNLKGKSATKRCLCIPLDESGVFIGKQGVYLNLTAIEMQNPKFTDTHCIKVQLDKDVYDKLTQEQKDALPIIGGLHQIERKQEQMNVTGFVQAQDDDLPF